MLLTNPLACPETAQQTGQKHFRGEINNQPLGATYNSSSQHQAVGARVSLLWEIRGMKGYGKYGRQLVRRVWEIQGQKGYRKYKERTKALDNSHSSAREPSSTISTTGQASIPHPFPPRDTKQFRIHPKPHTTKKEVPLALEAELTHSAVSYRTTSRQQRF